MLPDLDARELRDKLGARAQGFVWVKRELTPRAAGEVHRARHPGHRLPPENKRIYPNGTAAAHMLGFANIDNRRHRRHREIHRRQGLQDLNGAGFDARPTDLKPVQLSLDLRVQHVVRDELVKGMASIKAKAAGGVVLDVNTGEVLALVSLPDYDPEQPGDALEKDRINRIMSASSRWARPSRCFTIAMALDSGKVTLNSTLRCARRPALGQLHHPRLSRARTAC